MANINTEGIVLHKRLLNHWLNQEDRVFSNLEAFIWILLNATTKGMTITSFGYKYTLKRGQLATNHTALAQEFKWSRGKVKRFLEKLVSENTLKYNISAYKRTQNGHKTDTKTMVISVCKYESYNVYKKTVEHKTDTKRTHVYNCSISIYSTFYAKNIEEPYMWNAGVDDQCLKKLIGHIEKNIISYYKKNGQNDFQVPDDMLVKKFESFLNSVPELYIYHSLSLQTLLKSYNTIVLQIAKNKKNKKNKKNNDKPQILQGDIFKKEQPK